jgi:uncharacterized damage-inducible protein DinB
MSRPILDDALRHHSWATLKLIDALAEVTEDRLATSTPGTFGSIIDTLRHTIGADSWYLHRLGFLDAGLTDEEEEALDVAGCRAMAERHAELWPQVAVADIDPDEIVVVERDDGTATHAPKGIRLAQVLHHGTDHRSQICTALTALGIEPPEIDLWAFGLETGRVTQTGP